MLNQYGAQLREMVTAGFNVKLILEMHQSNAFENDVSAYPTITVIEKNKQGRAFIGKATIESSEYKPLSNDYKVESIEAVLRHRGISADSFSSWHKSDAPWINVEPKKLELLKTLERKFFPIESAASGTKVGIGVATGADRIFITRNHELVEADRLLPLAMVSDIEGNKIKWSGNYLVNPWNEQGLVDLQDYPRLKNYFAGEKTLLAKRHTAFANPSKWYKTIDRVNFRLIKKRKLYVADIKDRLIPILDEGNTYPHHNLYFIESDKWDLKVLGGLLMSAVAQFFIDCYGVRIRGGYMRFQAQYLRRIRVPEPSAISPEQSKELIAAFESNNPGLATEIACAVYGIDAKTRRSCFGY
jgi:hypothetical protein